MVKTVEEGFREFHRKLTPTNRESEAAKQHRATIEACLREKFGVTHFFRTGSFGNGTSICRNSDVDYFAVIPSENLRSRSAYMLQLVKQALSGSFPLTDVKIKSPAVTLSFGGGEEITEVVPAYHLSSAKSYGGYGIYYIPDGNNGWVRSSPQKHKGWVNQVNKALSYKVKPLIRFMKAWNCCQRVKINSFYLELRVTKLASEIGSVAYSQHMRNALQQLWNCQLAAIQDPVRISGLVQPDLSSTQKEEALSKLRRALTRADKAVASEMECNTKTAFHYWNLIFDGNFPSYYGGR